MRLRAQDNSYLGEQVEVAIADGVAVITLPDAHSQRAERALARFAEAGHASRRGRYAQAIRLYKEGLEILPGHAESRRQLGMAYMENGNPGAAKAQLIKAIQLNPHDAWAHLILGNLYFQAEHDLGSAERYYAAARDLAPDDAYVLNSYAGLLGKRGRFEEAAALFTRAIELAPQLPAPRLGLALALSQQGDDDGALAEIEAIFAQPVSDDVRLASVYADARSVYAQLRRQRATANADNALERMRQVLAAYQSSTGIEVRVETNAALLTDARIELAWRTGRPYHVIKVAGGGASAYAIAHEFEHLQMEEAARAAGVNRLFASQPERTAAVERTLEKEVRKIRSRRDGSSQQVDRYLETVIPGLLTQLYNLPLDCVINRRIHAAYPWLHDELFNGIAAEQAMAAQMVTRSDIRAMTPTRIYQASLAMNAAYALFADDLFGGITDYGVAYQPTGMLTTGRELFALYRQTADAPGAELDLVDAWARVLGLTDWFAWSADRSAPVKPAPVKVEGVTNAAYFSDPSAEGVTVFYLLDALRRFAAMKPAAIWSVASEIALRGAEGIDYGSDEQYTLRSLPGETFSGVELLCLQYVAFQLTRPDLDLGLPFAAAYRDAQRLFEAGS